MSIHDNINIIQVKPMVSPNKIISEYPLDENTKTFIDKSRKTISNIINNYDKRLLCVVGPCSIHNPDMALEYAQELKKLHDKFSDSLYIIMRVYFEKPRTRTGWKGLINDPDLDNTYNIEKGLSISRKLLLTINKMGLPTGCEFLDTITPQYFSDLVSWGAIGARTTQSQIHRQLASGLSMPIGFKNGTDGNFQVAIDGTISASSSHTFPGVERNGKGALFITKGNSDCHIILRGGKKPNYHQEHIKEVLDECKKENINKRIIIDFSHGNSEKDFTKQLIVCNSIARQITQGNLQIGGAMIESNLVEGKQKFINKQQLAYGVSITDSCVNLKTTEIMLTKLSKGYEKAIAFYKVIPAKDFNTLNQDDDLVSARKLVSNCTNYIFDIMHNNKSTFNYTKHTFDVNPQYNKNTGISVYIDDLIENSTKDIILNISKNCSDIDIKLLQKIINERVYNGKHIAEAKFNHNPLIYLKQFNNFDEQVYDIISMRDVELKILEKYNNLVIKKNKQTIYFKELLEILFDLTKKVQLKYLKQKITKHTIGYLGGEGTISYEALSTLNNDISTIAYENFDKLRNALTNNDISFAFVPVFNTIKGDIDFGFNKFIPVGKVVHQVHLDILSSCDNTNAVNIKTIYSHPVAFEEADIWLSKNCPQAIRINTSSTLDACKKAIQDNNHSAVLCSKNCQSILLKSIVNTEIVNHNFTTFCLFKN